MEAKLKKSQSRNRQNTLKASHNFQQDDQDNEKKLKSSNGYMGSQKDFNNFSFDILHFKK